MDVEFGQEMLEKILKKRRTQLSVPGVMQGLEIHFYYDDIYPLVYLKGRHSAEDLCTEIAKKFGISPLCNSLFALYNEDDKIWYPPNHIFEINDATPLKLHYRMRFYFANWHGTNKNIPAVWRRTLKRNGSHGTALLDVASLAYLYEQCQYDFVKGHAPVRNTTNEDDIQQIENECLGMAVMAISHQAMLRDLPIQKISKKNRYKNCIPKNMKDDISHRSILTRQRISIVFRRFLKEFNSRTIQGNNVTPHDLKVKYISTMETLTQHFGSELFEPNSLYVLDSEGTHSGTAGPFQVLVSGNFGIKWRKKPSETPVSASDIQGRNRSQRRNRSGWQGQQLTNSARNDDWTVFADFHEITHIVIRDSVVTVFKQDNNKMELKLSKEAQPLSFASLVDGFFRLTVDAHHFLCTDVAPNSVEIKLRDGCHGPISTDYAMHKLRQEGNEVGMYVLRWSSAEYDHILLTVICEERDAYGSELTKSFKNFQIKACADGYRLCGTDILQPTLKALTDYLSGQCLRSDHVSLRLSRGCPPQPREASNLLVVTRPDAASPPPPDCHVIFHRIHSEDIIQMEHLGHGTRTNIYAGMLRVRSEDEEYPGERESPQQVKVVLKVLGAGHISAFLETVSMMRQVSHKHIALLYGICVRNMDTIMVEEFVHHGPLDLFMRNHHLCLTPSWKFQVAKQLASALSYLEDKKLVHGYVCTKNILLARDGMDNESAPFIKLSDPGLPITVLCREECIDRIPWIAPECVKDPRALSIAADKWAFGTTLWEICHNGEVPLHGKKLTEKERFYEAECALVTPDSSELADFITQCMNYDPRKRLFFRAIVRDLDRLEEQNPVMVTSTLPTQEVDPTIFERRFLKKVRDLGEGHFGKVELCLYDPHGDQTGDLVAVKSLKSESDGLESNNLRREINTMRELYHNNIVKYKGMCNEEGGRTIKLIMEYLPLGSLKEFLPRNKPQIDLKRLLLYAVQICRGMDYLGSQNYIHRDLAARNVLMENESLVKIGDFGLTKSIKENEDYYRMREEQDSPVYWYAPECLIHRKFYKASDVWSFGVTLYELMTYCERKSSPPEIFLNMIGRSQGQMTMTKLVKALEDGWRLPHPTYCPDVVYAQMQKCWRKAPEDRVEFKSLIQVFEDLISKEEFLF
ncbi:tyrosine-protein kinase JAK1 [Chanos chanos]|uniref:Tyrosine-protein kinase n=1 Tax=Chanos chanos TaxID=29144 RepID=A0A6J2VBD2_CHACN|nr:tyrosine-protein kinase JAK1-like [Chanos chanos]